MTKPAIKTYTNCDNMNSTDTHSKVNKLPVKINIDKSGRHSSHAEHSYPFLFEILTLNYNVLSK